MNYNLYPNVHPNISPNANSKRTGQKVTLIVVMAVVGVVALLIGWVLFVEYYGTTANNDFDEFVTGSYTEHPDGDIAAEYLPKYEELSDYEWVDYYYFDASLARKLMGAYGDSFVVDVKYDESVFEEKKKEVFAHYFGYDDAAYRNAVSEDFKTQSNRHVVATELESTISYFPYGNAYNGFYIEYDDTLCIIRYCFVHRIGYLNVLSMKQARNYFQNQK